MTLNTALLKAKVPYFIALLAIGLCMDYLLQQLSITHVIICVAICLYAVLEPNTFCIFPKNHEYDEYNIISSLPSYVGIGGISFIGFMIANNIGWISTNIISIMSVSILAMLMLGIIDRSRYN